jgi:hypothetical protein
MLIYMLYLGMLSLYITDINIPLIIYICKLLIIKNHKLFNFNYINCNVYIWKILIDDVYILSFSEFFILKNCITTSLIKK